MNPIIKVYGHQRSGNNYLCALMYKNFYSGMKSAGTKLFRGNRPFVLFGEEVPTKEFFHPYGNIIGSHDPREVTADSIYIVRNWEDVQKSLEARDRPTVLMFDHPLHVYIALENMPYVVYYEKLKENPEKVLSDIQHHFQLNRLYKDFIIEVGYCGWPP